MSEELFLCEERLPDLLIEVLFNWQLEFLPTWVSCLGKRIRHNLRKPGERLAQVIQNIDFGRSGFAIAPAADLYQKLIWQMCHAPFHDSCFQAV